MAVTDIRKKWEGRGATADEEDVYTLTLEWDVDTDDDATAEPDVVNAVIAAYPYAAVFQPHPRWPVALRRKITCDPNGGPRRWKVKADYSSAPFKASGDGTGSSGNPASPDSSVSQQTRADLRPPKISITRKEVTKVLEFDAVDTEVIGGVTKPKGIRNTLGDPFNPLPEVFRSHHIITFKFHRLPVGLQWSTRSLYQDSINLSAVNLFGRVYPAHSLRCVDYSFDTEWDTGDGGLALFFALTCQLEYNPDLWDIRLLNTGRRKRVGGSIGDPTNPARLVAIVDDNGQPISDPIPLDSGGVPVLPGGEYYYVSVNGYPILEWLGTDGTLLGYGGLLY